jgi:deoxyribodipyrimidine photo-lyase
MKVALFWFRRDLRLEDNTALNHALDSGYPVVPVFIFDEDILRELPADDARLNFIYDTLRSINEQLNDMGSGLLCIHDNPKQAWQKLAKQFDVAAVYTNKDYEPYARERDAEIKQLLEAEHIEFHMYKDQVIFEENEVLKNDGKPYTVFTPYKNKWLDTYHNALLDDPIAPNHENFHRQKYPFPELTSLGFEPTDIKVKPFDLGNIVDYDKTRDYPTVSTSYLSPHLRFGTVSARQIIERLKPGQDTFLSELIWREFFMQILYHFPRVVEENFKVKYNGIQWRDDEADFKKWCEGKTGYPMVDAGMRELNNTGYMHNRVRMVTASFLCKHLLIDWRWGEAYFAKKLLDFELSSNNGNWQWAAGTGCDAAPYFRIFNPESQLKKFDKNLEYVKKWVPEFGTPEYPEPMVDHKMARERALERYKAGIQN